ncbi:DMT family transporter [Lentibacter sp. XHP0401]|uniref:DMT family transporter n=1 Tax=Lentibacter sp. XHP0401 TaxID=2984334 RepID=UPI0021E99465|nr:DMT family transporter [Lentibacter sp. XHP0401]MCV2891706.1 DMT family transporter [Lentibacter sp. XHP0401]
MNRKTHIDLAGAAALTAFAIVLGFNQVVIKVSNGGFQPVFMAGLRSAFAFLVLLAWMRYRGVALGLRRDLLGSGVLLGALFTFEFICLFLALDLTTVSRASIIFYSMPVWLTLAAHFVLPGERMRPSRAIGLILAMAGVIWVLAKPQESAQASLTGDFLALGAALGWAGIALVLRLNRISNERSEVQLLWQLGVSVPMLMAMSLFFGPFLREPALVHWAGLAFQVLAVASFGYLIWFVLLKIYPASGVASFSFLSPVCGVGLGWLLLNEQIGPEIIGGLLLVAVGLVLINRKPSVAKS